MYKLTFHEKILKSYCFLYGFGYEKFDQPSVQHKTTPSNGLTK